jgi:hypothetical protein
LEPVYLRAACGKGRAGAAHLPKVVCSPPHAIFFGTQGACPP